MTSSWSWPSDTQGVNRMHVTSMEMLPHAGRHYHTNRTLSLARVNKYQISDPLNFQSDGAIDWPTLLALCDKNPRVTDGFTSQRTSSPNAELSLLLVWTSFWTNSRVSGDFETPCRPCAHLANMLPVSISEQEDVSDNSQPPNVIFILVDDLGKYLKWSTRKIQDF